VTTERHLLQPSPENEDLRRLRQALHELLAAVSDLLTAIEVRPENARDLLRLAREHLDHAHLILRGDRSA